MPHLLEMRRTEEGRVCRKLLLTRFVGRRGADREGREPMRGR